MFWIFIVTVTSVVEQSSINDQSADGEMRRCEVRGECVSEREARVQRSGEEKRE